MGNKNSKGSSSSLAAVQEVQVRRRTDSLSSTSSGQVGTASRGPGTPPIPASTGSGAHHAFSSTPHDTPTTTNSSTTHSSQPTMPSTAAVVHNTVVHSPSPARAASNLKHHPSNLSNLSPAASGRHLSDSSPRASRHGGEAAELPGSTTAPSSAAAAAASGRGDPSGDGAGLLQPARSASMRGQSDGAGSQSDRSAMDASGALRAGGVGSLSAAGARGGPGPGVGAGARGGEGAEAGEKLDLSQRSSSLLFPPSEGAAQGGSQKAQGTAPSPVHSSGLKMPKLGSRPGLGKPLSPAGGLGKSLGGGPGGEAGGPGSLRKPTWGGGSLSQGAGALGGRGRRGAFNWPVPRLPNYFVKTSEYHAVYAKVMRPEFLQSESSTVVLEGVSGCGKTMLAKALCASEQIKMRFPDGIIWLYVGELTTREAICVRLLDAIADATTAEGEERPPHLVTLGWGPTQYIEQLVCALHGHAHLLVLDDVWDSNVVMLMKHLGMPMLVTTRNMQLREMLEVQPTPFSGAALSVLIHHTLGSLNNKDVRELLHAVIGVDEIPEDAMKSLLMHCSRLALELTLLGSLINIHTEHKHMEPVAAIELVVQQLRRIQLEVNLRHSTGVSSISQTHLRFWCTTTLSFSMLSAKHQARAYAMAILPKGHVESLERLQLMWNCSRQEATSTASKMARLNLLHTVSKQPTVQVVLPELVMDFIRHRAHMGGPDMHLMDKCMAWLSRVQTLVDLVDPTRPQSVYTFMSLWNAMPQSTNAAEHLQPILDACAMDGHMPPEVEQALLPAGQVLQLLGLPKEATFVYQACLRRLHENSTPEEFDSKSLRLKALQLYFSLGECLTVQGLHSQAYHSFNDATKLASKLGKSAHVVCEVCMMELACSMHRAHKLSQAVIVHKLAFEMAKAQYGPNHAATAYAQRDAAHFALVLGNRERAQELATRAVQVGKAALGRNHPQVAELLKFLAVTLLQVGKADEAQVAICRAFALVQSMFGAKSTNVIRAMNAIAIILNGVGKHKDAADVLHEAREITDRSEGLSSPLTAMIIANQAVTHLMLGNGLKSKNLVTHALEIMDKTMHSASEEVACSLHCLGAALTNLRDFQAAKDIFVRCATIRSLLYGKKSMSLAAMLDTYGSMMVTIGRHHHASKYLRMSVAITEDHLNHNIPEDEELENSALSERPMSSMSSVISSGNGSDSEGNGSDSDTESSVDSDGVASGGGGGSKGDRDAESGHTHPDLAKAIYLLAMVKKHEGNQRKAKKLMARYEKIVEMHPGHPALRWVENLTAERDLAASLAAHEPGHIVADPDLMDGGMDAVPGVLPC